MRDISKYKEVKPSKMQGNRKLIVTIIGILAVLLIGYSMKSDMAVPTIAGVAGIVTAYIGGNVLNSYRRSSYESYEEYENEAEY